MNEIEESSSAQAERGAAVILAGPTGAGKTELAIALARRGPYELVSADSMQVYRGMEIGTAQPTVEELAGISIHGCGVIAPDEPFDAMRFVRACEGYDREIRSRGRVPLYVGGTGMYLRALRFGLFEGPGADPQLRAKLAAHLERGGPEALHEELRRVDARQAERIAPRDAVRIVRALEVARGTGRTMSDMQSQWQAPRARFPHRLFILACPREALVRRIERRVDRMIESGWIDEARALLAAGYSPSLHAFKALGYREIVQHLRGEMDEAALRERIKARTRQFAKRQMTWFRKEPGATWIDHDGTNPASARALIEKSLEAPDSSALS